MLHIDSSFAIAPVVNPGGDVSWELQCPTILGHLGAFFSDFETRYDAVKRNCIARGPVVQAHLELLGEAVDAIEGVRSKLTRQVLLSSGLELDAAAPALAPDDDGWELVARRGDAMAATRLEVVERSVNAVVLTRLWPTLEDLLSGVERVKDNRIALGLPAFGWDDKGLGKLVDHLGIPACFLPRQKAAASSEAAEAAGGLPLFYAAASERLRDMMRVKTPEDKAEALAAAARSILVCIEQHLSTICGATSCAPSEHGATLQPDMPLKSGAIVSVATLLQRCLAFTVLRVAHEDRASSFRRFALSLPFALLINAVPVRAARPPSPLQATALPCGRLAPVLVGCPPLTSLSDLVCLGQGYPLRAVPARASSQRRDGATQQGPSYLAGRLDRVLGGCCGLPMQCRCARLAACRRGALGQ